MIVLIPLRQCIEFHLCRLPIESIYWFSSLKLLVHVRIVVALTDFDDSHKFLRFAQFNQNKSDVRVNNFTQYYWEIFKKFKENVYESIVYQHASTLQLLRLFWWHYQCISVVISTWTLFKYFAVHCWNEISIWDLFSK